MKKLANKGTGVNQVILLTAVLLFILIPIFTVMIEKVHVKMLIHDFEEVGDMAVLSAVSQLDTLSLAEGNLSIEDINQVNNFVYNRLNENCDSSYSLDNYSFNFYKNGEICPYQFSSPYVYFHLYFTIQYKRIANSQQVSTIHIHLDVEVPIDR
ncbi:MAG: hypothetical protein KAG94_04360 [Clostridiales bacterium]|nr:hypothetical protein [Clostridiales bacterium]